jgi:hypothetical protein
MSIQFTIFDPVSGEPISYNTCTHEDLVPAQVADGQAIIMGHQEPGWLSAGDEGLVRDGEEFVPLADWIEQHSPDLALTHQPTEE